MDIGDVFRKSVGQDLRRTSTCVPTTFHDIVLIVVRVSSICPKSKDMKDLSVCLMLEDFFKVTKTWKFPVKH